MSSWYIEPVREALETRPVGVGPMIVHQSLVDAASVAALRVVGFGAHGATLSYPSNHWPGMALARAGLHVLELVSGFRQ